MIKRADLNGSAFFTFVNVQLQALAESVLQLTSRIKSMQVALMAIMIFIHKISLILTLSIDDFIITAG
ncbi:hypothetical protein ABIE66_004552 [Peribacillus sp. B2I2]|uniref:hypothetical protein n=1 Tax=Peribacillus sp. B2I2 TaxID=3156468 RepID=UPI0035112A3C